MKFDLFVSDFDKTLGKLPEEIDESVVKAIKEYTAKGGKFAIATGRLYKSVKRICDKYGIKGLVASYQGAMITDMESEKTLFVSGIEPECACEVAKRFEEENLCVVADIDDNLYYDKENSYVTMYEDIIKIKAIKVDNIIEFIKNSKLPVLKLGGIGDTEITERVIKEYPEKYKGELLFNGGISHLVEVITPEASKGEAVKFMANYYNIPLDRVLAVGDSTNDVELIGGSWYGVCVGDGRDEAKAVADEITVPFNEHPVKVLLEKYCL